MRSVRIAACATVLAACGFAREATVVTFGAPDLPAVSGDVELTEAVLREAILRNATGPVAVAPSALPSAEELGRRDLGRLIEGATYRDVRDVLCTAASYGLLPEPGVDLGDIEPSERVAAEPPTAITARVEAARAGADCREGGLRVEATVTRQALDEGQLADLRGRLTVDPAVIPDAIALIRFDFDRLAFVAHPRAEDDAERDLTATLGDFALSVGVAGSDAPPELVVPGFLLETIGPDAPQRFGLDPGGEVTRALEQSVAGQRPPPDLVVTLSAELAPEALADVAIEGSGFVFAFQPEVVVNGWAVAAELL